MSEKENENLQKETNEEISNEVKQQTNEETTKELKEETVNTVKQVKDTVKNVNIKEETKKTQGLLTEMFKNPIATLKKIASDKQNHFFKTAIFIFIVWVIIALIDGICSQFSGYYGWFASFRSVGKNILNIIKITISPIISVIVLSLIVFMMNKKDKKPLTTVITTIVAVKIPVVIGEFVGLLIYLSSNASALTIPFASLCRVISIVLSYFGIKELLEEKDDGKFIKTFLIIQAIYYLAVFVISFLGIRI